jgi:glycosyltransferase involved in cell wall biosynthesis
LKKINLNVPINSMGYGVVGYNVWKQLTEMSDVTLWAIPDERQIDPPAHVGDDVVNKIRRDVAKQDYLHNGTCLKIWHENHLSQRIGGGKFVVLPFFEVSKFNDRRRTHLSSADEVIVTSEWAKEVVVNQCDKGEVHVIPCGVDREIFNESNNKESQKCIFFNCGKWEVRKGHDVLHKAFKDAFGKNDEVELWMMTQNPFLSPEETKSWKKLYSDPKIKLIDRVQFQHQLAEIMAQTYCGVFPARAEGWNLEALEMMACGKQVIITNYSAHTQFCNNDNSKLINIVEEEPVYDGKWFVGDNGVWASLDGDAYDELVDRLRQVYEEWKTDRKINQAGIDTSKELTWENCAKQINEVL